MYVGSAVENTNKKLHHSKDQHNKQAYNSDQIKTSLQNRNPWKIRIAAAHGKASSAQLDAAYILQPTAMAQTFPSIQFPTSVHPTNMVQY
jgi:hypothetical protein